MSLVPPTPPIPPVMADPIPSPGTGTVVAEIVHPPRPLTLPPVTLPIASAPGPMPTLTPYPKFYQAWEPWLPMPFRQNRLPYHHFYEPIYQMPYTRNQATEDFEVDLKPGTFIPVPMPHFRYGLRRHLTVYEIPPWEELCANLELHMSSYWYRETKRSMETLEIAKVNYRVDAQAEMDLYHTISHLLGKASFFPLKQKWYDVAQDVNFSFHLPVVTDWESMYSPMMSSFAGNSAHLYDDGCPPRFAKDMMFFVRGLGSEEKTDLFINEKINFVLSAIMSGKFGLLSKSKTYAKSMNARRLCMGDHFKRLGLGGVLGAKITLREPTFESIIMVYRQATADTRLSSESEKKYKYVVSKFNNVPMADIEALFPIQRVQLLPLNFVIFLSQIVTLGIFFVTGLFQLDDISDPQVIVLFLGFLGALLYRAYALTTAFSTMIQFQMNEMMSWLERKRSGEGEMVVSFLRDLVIDQEMKEAMLTYFTLWQRGPADRELLRRTIEVFIQEEYGKQLEFDIDDGLHKLETMGLVHQMELGRYAITGPPGNANMKFERYVPLRALKL